MRRGSLERMIAGAGGPRARDGPRVLQALEALYPDMTASAAELGRDGRADTFVRYMRRKGYISRDPATCPARYRLTPAGRCRALCARLGVGMLGLCIMAEAYATHLSQREAGCAEMYLVRSALGLLDGVYSESSVRNAASGLRAAGHARRVRHGAIRLAAGAMGVLAESHDTVDGLHAALAGTPHRLDMEHIRGMARAGRAA